MDDDNPIADCDQEEGGVYLCLIAGWQSGVHPQLGVALRLSYFTSREEIRRDTPSGIQLLLSAAHAVELGEELLRQGQAALGASGQSLGGPNAKRPVAL